MSFNPLTVIEGGKWSGYDSNPISQKEEWGIRFEFMGNE